MMPVTSLFVVLLALSFIRYSMMIIAQRREQKVAVFDGGEPRLGRIIRAQGNLFEYGVLMAMLVGLSEAQGVPGWLCLVFTLAFFAGRASHGYGLVVAELDEERGPSRFRWRVGGMAVTFFSIISAVVVLCVAVVVGLIGG